MLSPGLSQARERHTAEASVVTASAAETAPGLHPRARPAPPTGLQPGLPESCQSIPCAQSFSELLARLLSGSLPSLPGSSPASLTETLSTSVLRCPGLGGQPRPQPRPWVPPPQGAPLARVLCGPGRSLPCVSAQPVSDCPSLSSCSFEDTSLSPSSAAPVLSVRPGRAFQTALSPRPLAPVRPSACCASLWWAMTS